ncbi:carboxymuconolactone decarboxylase family protein [Neomicrococcus aestuarii]|uniref:Carboxymuconolactone decarboxylase-like domain-containing protein n=1 Tax=Neomicrococcus aestuarii TaxID=556325 RepID=A0A1L2ZPB1_9MICC|nr:carboxymuconolactone decarboxylase family protein [Neomicrococcus aestuarii]APF41037.1 hypothetical protein BHE16_08540 [Neomicrococcus aestuarii]
MSGTEQHENLFIDRQDQAIFKALNAVALRVGEAIDAAEVSRIALELMYVRISQINGCVFCLDRHVPKALQAGASHQQLAVVAAWRDSSAFTTEERLALELGEVVTELPDPEFRKEIVATVRAELGDPAASALTWAAINMNAFNRVSILSHHPVTPHTYPTETGPAK